jgi:hypothetical protein
MALGWRGQYFRYKEFYLNILALYRRRADLRGFIEIILSLSTIAIFLVFALKPTALTIISLVKEINGKKTTLVGLNQKVNDLQTAQGVYIQNQDLISNVDTAVATKPLPDAISKQIVGLAAKNSVSVSGLSIEQVTLIGKSASPKKTAEFKPLPGDSKEMAVSMSIKGDYLSLLSFVKDLENLRIISKIDLVGISSSVNSGERTTIAKISIRVPYLGG